MTNTTKDIPEDAIKTRLYAKGTWKLESVAHFGGDETGIADMCLLRDPDGNPFIPAASIAGAARSYLASTRLNWKDYSHPNGIKKEPEELRKFFGGAGKDDTMSALIVADAKCVTKDAKTFIRDGVRIERKPSIAADGAKYDVEVVERKTEFQLEFVCIIRKGDCKSEYKKLFLALLHGFENEDIRLGARTRRGYGRGRVNNWDIRDLKMKKPQHVLAWLSGIDWNSSVGKSNKLTPTSLPKDQRKYFRIEADFQLRTSLLIRSASTELDEPGMEHPDSNGNPVDNEEEVKYKLPDMVHLHSNGKPVIPGTSFAGAFRHRATLIAKTIGWSDDNVNKMFGYVKEKKSDNTQQADAQASRVWIEEKLVENVKSQWQDRVAIDRFTGGSLQSALFNQKPVYPCPIKAKTQTNVRLRLTIEEPEKAEIGLLLLTLRDFWYGHAALGGEASNGRGTLQGIKAKLIYKDTHAKECELIAKNKHMKVKNGDAVLSAENLQCYVNAAQNYKNRPTASRRPANNDKEEETDAE